MIQFNELRITPNADRLIVEAQLKQDSYFSNMAINYIKVYKINNAEKEETLLIKDNPLGNLSLEGTTPSIAVEIEQSDNGFINKVRYVLDATTLGLTSLENVLLRVEVNAVGIPSEDMPEGYASPIVSVLVCDLYPFYIKTLSNLRMLDDLSSNSDVLIDCILRFKSLELAFKTGNTNLAIQYWFKYFAVLDKEYGRSFLKVNHYE
jgi:hypothetical protein